MSSLNATTSSGIVATADNTATLQLQTAGTNALNIDASQNVGIGVAPYGVKFVIYQDQNGLTYSDINNPNTGSSAGAITRLISSNVAGSGTVSADLVKYKAGGLVINNNETNSAAFTSFGVGSSERMRIDSSGNLLIGRTNNPSGLSNGLYVPGIFSNTTPSAANVFINTDGSFFRSTSSLRYKDNVQDATHGLAEVLKLRSVTYNGKNDLDAQIIFGGFIAEEVDAAGLNEFVVYNEDGKPDALQYGNMVALMAKAIQEQQAIIETLKADIAELKEKVGK